MSRSDGPHLSLVGERDAANARFQALYERMPDPAWVISEGRCVECNQAALRSLGFAGKAALQAHQPWQLAPQRQADGQLSPNRIAEMMARVHAHGTHQFHWIFSRADGTSFPAEISAVALTFDGKPAVSCSWRDISDRRLFDAALSEEHSRLEALVKAVPDLMFQLDRKGNYVGVWAQNEELLAGQKELLLGRNVADVLPAEAARVCLDMIDEADRLRHSHGKVIQLDVPAGIRFFELSASKLEWHGQEKAHFVVLSRDVTARMQSEERMRYLAQHDALTGLANRGLFDALLEHDLLAARRERTTLALMFIDLDGFKPVNDNCGHAVGDLLLQDVAQRMAACMRSSDTLGRIGGDEFVAMLPAIGSGDNALQVAEELRAALEQPFSVNGLELAISCSIGVALYPAHAGSPLELTRNADMAMYHAKAEGRNRTLLFRPGMERIFPGAATADQR